jgi:hypothetical protein
MTRLPVRRGDWSGLRKQTEFTNSQNFRVKSDGQR